ncbi:MAG: hypothetical protein IJ574_06175 [Bacilli bacterium]|nr:hypothetical protein [Bacilli bacterium]
MIKLNNRGWGFRDMIIIMCVLIIVLFVAVYYIHRLYDIKEINEANARMNDIKSNNNSYNEVKKEDNTINDSSNTSNNEVNEKVITTNYTVLEKKLSQSAINYVIDLNETITDDYTLTLTFNELHINKYIDNLIEEEGKSTCDGYAIVYSNDGNLISDPYITCSHYQTPNFESWRLN